MLGGDKKTVASLEEAVGKKIRDVVFKDNALRLTFDDQSVLSFWDNDSQCCEKRYMTTSDDLTGFEGATFTGVVLRVAPPHPALPDDYCHDSQFLAVKTSGGEFVMETHNEHNGYYSGFNVIARLEWPKSRSEMRRWNMQMGLPPNKGIFPNEDE